MDVTPCTASGGGRVRCKKTIKGPWFIGIAAGKPRAVFGRIVV